MSIITHPSEKDAYKAAGLYRCYICDSWKSPECFHKNNHHSSRGLQSFCKACNPSRARLYLQTPAGKAIDARKNHRRRRLGKCGEATLTSEQWQKILDSYNHSCYICGQGFAENNQPTRDHIIPLTRGGGLTADNVAPACRSCNSRKGARTPDECPFSFASYPFLGVNL